MRRDTVLIIEDDPALLRGLRDNFESRGFQVVAASDGRAGLESALGGRPDLIVLDVMLPEVNGFEICRAVRQRALDMPIIMVTAQGQERDVVRGLNLGADDYVTKPFSVAELLARADAFLRRRRRSPAKTFAFGDCRLDLESHRLTKAGEEVALTPKEFKLLEFLVRHAGRALTRDEIMSSVWSGVLVTGRSVDRCITTLRAKIEPDPREPAFVQTIRDIGYRFELPEPAAEPAEAGAPPIEPGAFVGRYRIEALLGRGGMAEVWRATDTRLGRAVAVKVLASRLAGRDEVLARFEREARAVAALSHRNVVAIHDVGSSQGRAFAVMELCTGETLRERLKRGPLAWRDAVAIAAAVADGLAAAHAKGIVHRDIKPENVFLGEDGGVKVLDFGLVRVEDVREDGRPASLSTSVGTLLGTPDYMSPEQVRGRATDAQSDLFSLGSVLFEMVSGRRPFERATAADTLAAILKDDAGLEGAAERPLDLDRLIQACLAKDPGARPPTARDLALRLRRIA